ncbi:MAG: hypothetical protein ACRDY2_00995 [Acidimicrobiales bacterium]
MPDGDEDIDHLLEDLTRWAAESRTSEEAGSRKRESWLRQQAAEETSLESLLMGWAERGAWLRLTTVTGVAHNGRIVGLGRDFVLLGTVGAPAVRAVLLRTSGIASIGAAAGQSHTGRSALGEDLARFETAPDRRPGELGSEPAPPDRNEELSDWTQEPPDWTEKLGSEPGKGRPPLTASPAIDLAGVLAGLATERPRLRMVSTPASSTVGELRWVGSDVACLRTDGPVPTPAYVPLPGVVEVAILAD